MPVPRHQTRRFPLNMNVVNMLNVRYLVVPGRLPEGMFPVAHMDGAQRSITYENPTRCRARRWSATRSRRPPTGRCSTS